MIRRPEYLRAPKGASAALPVRVAVPVAAEREVSPYSRRREAIYVPLRREGVFTWDCMYGEEYALADLQPIGRELREEIRRVSERIGAIYARVARVVMCGGPELMDELGIPPAARDAVATSLKALLPTLIGRFDFAATAEGLKLLEFNAETPTDVVEAFYVNGRVCEYYDAADPNAGMAKDLRWAFARAVTDYRRAGAVTDRIAFSAVDWHAEDAGTTRYLLGQSGLTAKFVPLSLLRVLKDKLQIQSGLDCEPVDLLYRLHPLEKLAGEQAEDGYPTGAHVLDIAARGRLALINPAAALISQSKATQALIWELHEAGEFFTDTERVLIEKYFLPTYFANPFIGKRAYVTKPLFGREGGAVTLWDSDGQILMRDTQSHYWDQAVIYQQYAELPQTTVETLNGLYCGRLIFGSFLIAGKGSAVVARVGSRITDNMAYYLPLCMEG